MNKFLLVFCVLFMVACTAVPTADKIIYVTTPLQLPSRPTLPTWTSNDMECLTVDVKQKMLERERLRKNYIEQLEAVIQTTHSK